MKTLTRSLGFSFQIAPAVFIRIHACGDGKVYSVDISGVTPTLMRPGDWIIPCMGLKIHLLSSGGGEVQIGVEKKKLKVQTA